ncbi:Eukaryotic translation initiation factor isoform 4G-1 [Vitis vinifera]|uniref:Eukaryotic translation initiation factor isoform 4G-1 n=1 Tax=Vitis vinifera TaxID=29760 RepID=A0A438KFD3_VITVI|nr:Eukaryotic translation initiation factor isoform 4G-1 [Vitis vinifera]
MQQADQTVISLRPGGGGGPRGTRFLASRFDSSSSSSSDAQPLRPHGGLAPSSFLKSGDLRFEGRERVRYTRDQLLQLREIKQEIESEFGGEDQNWNRGDGNVQPQSQSRYAEPDNRDWRGRSSQLPATGEDRSWESIRDNKELPSRFESRTQDLNNRQDQLNSQFVRAQLSSNQGVGPAPVLVKAEVPWSARRVSLSEQERVLKTVKGILNKLTPEKFDVLKGVISLIFDKAVLEPTFCPMYALLCSDLNEKLPPFPSEEPGGKEITFKRILLNNCQEAFEGADSLRAEIGLLTAPEQEVERREKERKVKLPNSWKHSPYCCDTGAFGHDGKTCPAEENVEAICQFFNTIGKQLDESQKSRRVNDLYFSRLKELTTNPQLAPRLRFMVTAKTITEIHSEAEKNLGLRPGATASMRNGRNTGALGGMGPGGFPISRPGSGGMMPGMPGTRKMPGMPGLDTDNWRFLETVQCQGLMVLEPSLPCGSSASTSQQPSSFVSGVEPISQTPKPVSQAAPVRTPEKPQAAAPRSNPVDLRRKTVSLLEEYFSVRILDEALQCVEELKSPAYHPEVVKEAVSLALEKSPPCVEPVIKLLVYLFNKNVLLARDLGTGCLLYGSLLQGGEGGPGEVEDDRFQAAIFDAVMSGISSDPLGEGLMEKHRLDIQDCKSLLG